MLNKRKRLFYNIVNKEVRFYKEFTTTAKDLIKKLLHKNYKKRLGYNGMDEVKKHKFFNNINWNKLLAKEVEPPFKPSMREINISNEFTSIPVMFNFEEEITRDERKLRSHFALLSNDKDMSNLNQQIDKLGDFSPRANQLSDNDNQEIQKLNRK